ncbi:MAG: phytanoyl-CoA dioxygenase family protein [Chitinophagales bacterium]|nr:phytanoyl-CoA dioxygenase family protein [Chitinophagales bacterium]MDW8417805.1 phytanoyl-CoA dioxygenase family protein [Chitinophagales bacterium]
MSLIYLQSGIRIKNIGNNHQYFSSGATIIPLLNEEQIGKLLRIFYTNFNPDNLPLLYDTIATEPAHHIKKINQEILSVIGEPLSNALENFEIVCSIFIIKKPGNDSYLNFHIDPTMTYRHLNNMALWIPLCDIDEHTGMLCLDLATRNMVDYYTFTMPCPFAGYEETIRKHSVCFPMKSGEALLFDNRILHCTERNLSTKLRVAVVSKIIDKSAPLVTVYYFKDNPPGKQAALYEHKRNIFLSGEFRLSVPPDDSIFVKYLPHLPLSFSEDAYLKHREEVMKKSP